MIVIEASAPGTTAFRSSIPWAVAIMLVPMAIAVTGTVLALNLLFGTGYGLDWDLLSHVALPALFGAGGAVGGSRHARRRRWVTVSAAGIELAEHGVPILIEWSNVASARVRRWGLFAVLEVIPVDLHLVRSLVPGPQVPAVQRLAHGLGFRLEVGNLWPTPHALRTAFTRHADGS